MKVEIHKSYYITPNCSLIRFGNALWAHIKIESHIQDQGYSSKQTFEIAIGISTMYVVRVINIWRT